MLICEVWISVQTLFTKNLIRFLIIRHDFFGNYFSSAPHICVRLCAPAHVCVTYLRVAVLRGYPDGLCLTRALGQRVKTRLLPLGLRSGILIGNWKQMLAQLSQYNDWSHAIIYRYTWAIKYTHVASSAALHGYNVFCYALNRYMTSCLYSHRHSSSISSCRRVELWTSYRHWSSWHVAATKTKWRPKILFRLKHKQMHLKKYDEGVFEYQSVYWKVRHKK